MSDYRLVIRSVLVGPGEKILRCTEDVVAVGEGSPDAVMRILRAFEALSSLMDAVLTMPRAAPAIERHSASCLNDVTVRVSRSVLGLVRNVLRHTNPEVVRELELTVVPEVGTMDVGLEASGFLWRAKGSKEKWRYCEDMSQLDDTVEHTEFRLLYSKVEVPPKAY